MAGLNVYVCTAGKEFLMNTPLLRQVCHEVFHVQILVFTFTENANVALL